ncbi:echinoderm microtubule-associated protein-like 2 [Saccostrea cucullata]|uniref:echinoderm microtubule-associated protein-like 2 n=1 Tax=Saccostrea cuccullata TaxID=36930 RepID=UPI002ED20F49
MKILCYRSLINPFQLNNNFHADNKPSLILVIVNRRRFSLSFKDSTCSESSVMGIPSRRDTVTSRGRNKNSRGRGKNTVDPSDLTGKKKVRRTPKATEIATSSTPTLNSPINLPQEQINPEEKFQKILSDNLKEYSRQRMRALHMSLRHFSNVETRITQKELYQAFQDNQIKLPSRITQFLIDRFEDNRGIDCERLYRFLTEAHLKSGRDSVVALQRRNDQETKAEMTSEERDADLIQRLEQLLIDNLEYFDIEALRQNFRSIDKDKSGKIRRKEVEDVCTRHQTPLYGALFKALLSRCDEESNNMVSWPEFLHFLDLSQQNAQTNCPRLCDLPLKVKSRAPVSPSPIDELSEETKSRLVSKLRKKVSMVKDRASSIKQDEDSIKITELNGDISHSEDKEVKPVTEEEVNPDRKRIVANMRRVSNLVKTSSGFLNTVKLFISGKRKSEPDLKKACSENGFIDNETILPNTSSPTSDVMSDSSNSYTEENTAQCSAPPSPPKPCRSAPVLSCCEVTNTSSLQQIHKNERHTFSITVKGRSIEFQPPCNVNTTPMILDPPTNRLKLNWVYGYRGNDCRSNIFVLASDEIVYFIANIAVLYSRLTHKQRHYREHNEDIKCLNVHYNGNIVATGQFTSKVNPKNQAHIRVWRADTLQTIHLLGAGMYQKSVLAMAFSGPSDLLAAVDDSPEKRLTLWDVSSGELKGDITVNTEVICDLQFNTKYPDVLVISGKEHLTWWKIYSHSRMIQPLAQPDYENFLKAKYVICLTHNDRGDLLTGDSNGTVYVWGDGGNKITNFIKHAHDGPVFTVLCMKSYIVTGGRDGFIYCWQYNKNMEKDGELQLPKSEGGVRLLVLHGDVIIIGTTVNSMLSITSPKKQAPLKNVTLDQVPMTQGHFSEVRGLGVVSRKDTLGSIVTAGTDGILCWFNPHGRDPVCKLALKGVQFLCVDALPLGKHLALGTRDGHVIVLDIDGVSSTESFHQKLCKDKITTIKFSPDGTFLAAGSADCCIYVCCLANKEDGSKSWEFTGKFKDHTGPVQSFDWSSEPQDTGYLIKSCTSVPEQFVWNATDFSQKDKDLDTRSIPWETETCAVDVSMCGLWSCKQAKNYDVHCVAVNSQNSLVAMGDSSGHISLFRYPCFKQGAYCHTYKGHSGVRNLVFSEDGQFLFSVGGRDLAILQWEVT